MPITLKRAVESFDKRSRDAMHNELRAILEDMRSNHQRVVSDWRNKPKFRLTMLRNNKRIIGVLAATQHGNIFKWLDQGTGQYGPKQRPYFIFPKRVPQLKFQTGYLPKTKPIARYNAGPGRAVGPWVSVDFVLHPGIKAREFTKDYWEKNVRPVMAIRIVRAIQRANR